MTNFAPNIVKEDLILTEEEVDELVLLLATKIKETGRILTKIYAMETGEVIAKKLAQLLNLPIVTHKKNIDVRTIVVDTVSESGDSFKKLQNEVGDFYSATIVMNFYTNFVPNAYCLLRKNKWIKFPFEEK